MSEEEIKGLQEHTDIIINEGLDSEDDIQGILKKWEDLYNKEKERNIASQKVIVELNDKLQNESISKDKIRCRLHDTNNWLDSGKYTHYGLNPYELKAVKKELEFLLEEDNK